MSNLIINGERLWETLADTARIGGSGNGGIARLTLSADDRRIRDWLRAECAALGMAMVVDEVGNMFATRPGSDASLPAIAMGSHLDTQPTGGRFDGVLGVLAGLEVLRTLHESGFVTRAPLMLVNWTNEEGARFSPAMLGSGVYAGTYDRRFADERLDAAGVRFADALEEIGYRGAAPAGSVRFGALFELHIEQGPLLEAEGRQIGIVTGVQGMRWLAVELTGRAAHTGSTPMTLRKDAMQGAARLIQAVEATALRHAPQAVGSVGFLSAEPNSNNVIAGRVRMLVDLRHPDEVTLAAMDEAVRAAAAEIAGAGDLGLCVTAVATTPPVTFDEGCIRSVRVACERAGLSSIDMISGAGHDAVHVARTTPTTMIFVPSRDGLSHNEQEFTAPDQCAAGAQVLLQAVLEHDRRLA